MRCYQIFIRVNDVSRKVKKKLLQYKKRDNFVLTVKLIFNVLTLKFWFSEINLYLVIPRQIF